MKGKYHIVVQNNRLRYEFDIRRNAVSGKYSNLLIIADGAAIGPEMNGLMQLMQHRSGIRCFLPESFEWLILKSGIIDGKEVQKILEAPENYIESSRFFSWERYFTKLLVEYTKDTFRQYSKSHLNVCYLQDYERKAIMSILPDLGLK